MTAFAATPPQIEGRYYLAGSMVFSPDGAILASGSSDGTIRLLDFVTGKELKKLEGRGSYIESNAFSPDGATLASGRGDGIIKLWDVVTGKELKTLQGHTSAVEVLAFSADGTVLASKSREAVKTWDTTSGKERESSPPANVEIARKIATIVPDLYRNSKSRPITRG